MSQDDTKNRLVFRNEYEIGEFVARSIRNSEAYEVIQEKSHEVNEYCMKYLMPDVWGKNMYLAIIEDAFRMRQMMEHKE